MLVLLAIVLYVALNDIRIESGTRSQYEKKRIDRDFLHGWRNIGEDFAGSSAESREDARKAEGGFPEEWKQEVQRSLEHFQAHGNASISKEGLLNAWQQLRHGFFVRISNGSMYVKLKNLHHEPWEKEFMRGRPQDQLCRIYDLLCSNQIPDMDFVFNYADEPVGEYDKGPYPVFSWTKAVHHTDFLIPYTSFNELPENAPDDCDFHESIENNWGSKKPLGIWRGATTGTQLFTTENWREQTRPQLVMFCSEHPDICNARISRYVQASKSAIIEMREEIGRESGMSPEMQDRYKYALVLDGNSAPSSRMRHHLERSSLILKQSSPFMEFFYSSLQPYIHYVPMSHSLEDLATVISWARENDGDAVRMVTNSKKFACMNFNRKTIRAYMKYVFSEYSKLFGRYRAPIETDSMVKVWFKMNITSTCPDIEYGQCPFFSSKT